MSSDLPAPSPETTYAVGFSGYVGGHYNRDLGGKGKLVVRPAEPRFVFSGKPRGWGFVGKTITEIPFRSDQLWNVLVIERGVQFSTAPGKSGGTKSPFVFTCQSREDAAAIAARLPVAKDAEFLADESFIQQVRLLPDVSGLGSVTNLVLLANAAVFIVMGLLGAGWFEVASMKPYITYGANNAAVTTHGQWWRLLTCTFMHYGIVHLVLNAWALFQVGHIVEKLFGRGLFALIYFGSGLIGSLATLLWKGDKVWSAGASGAVFGLFGALLGYLLREKHGVPAGFFRPMLRSTLLFAGFNLFFGAVHPNIDNAAHIGGLLGGAVLGWICALPIDREARNRLRPRRAVTGLVVATTLVTFGVVLAWRRNH